MSLRNEAYNSIKKKMRRLIVMDKISIIIPCFNEEEALPIYYAEMKKVMDSMKKQTSFELLFVDDGSSDRTYEIMKDLHRKKGRKMSVPILFQKLWKRSCDLCRTSKRKR